MANSPRSPDLTRPDGEIVEVPLVHDNLSFDGRQALGLKEMEKRVEAEMKRKKRDWEKEVERMRQEFLYLYPSDRVWGSDEMLHDPLVAKRRGSTDILDPKKMKTLFLDYPDTGRKYRLRFNVAGFIKESIRVSTDGDRIVVRANSQEASEDGGTTVERMFERKIQKPKEVDHTKFKSYLTSDSILIVEAPVSGSSHHDLRRAIQSPSHHSMYGLGLVSPRSRSPSNSPGQDTPSKEKIGVPIFREENGQRRLHLIVDLGTAFKPHDITVQVIKDNKILVRAKHEEKTMERLSKSKFSKEYELSEKIETYSLNGALSTDGKLIVGAFAKGHGNAKQVGGVNGIENADETNSKSMPPCNVVGMASGSSAGAFNSTN